ncbi:MAG: histidine kinase N-terminal 7TM domain-containing protein [Halorientalis sp.]
MGLSSLGLVEMLHLVPPVATIGLCVAMLGWLRATQWDTRGVRMFAVTLVVGGIIWQGLTITHVLTTNRALQAFIVVADKWVGMVTALCWAVFVSQYTNDEFHTRWPTQLVIGFIVVGYVVFAFLNPNGLLFADIQRVSHPFSFSSAVRGPLYFLILAVLYAVVTYGFYLLVRFLLTTRSGNGLRIALLVAGTMSVAVFNLASILELGPLPRFQYGSYGAFLFILCTTLAVFRLGLFDIAPIARNALVGSLSDPVVVVDEDGNVADFNQQAHRHWPEIDDHVAAPLATACPDLASSLDLDFETGQTTTATAEQITIPGEEGYHHYSVLLSPVGRGGSPRAIGYAILLREVTELEESRRQLKQQNEQLERVASTISHDLRNPLSVINGYVELLDQDIDDETHATYVTKIDDATDRMSAIIDDLLTIAREGKTIDETTEVDFESAAREAWDHVDTEQARLVVDRGGRVLADRSRLLSILENCFRNAVEHGRSRIEDSRDDENRRFSNHSTSPDSQARQDAVEHGSTTHRSQAQEDAVEHDSEDVTVSVGTFSAENDAGLDAGFPSGYGFYVADDGPGIPPDARETIFEYGFTTSDDGTGLGLAIVSAMAESHGWSITLDESYEAGTRFVFTDVFLISDDGTGTESGQ